MVRKDAWNDFNFLNLPRLDLWPPLFYCWFPPECFLSHLLNYSLCIDFFLISSRSLLNLSCIFSILVSRLSVTTICFQGFGSFSLSIFQILYQVDSVSLPLLFGLVGIYPVPFPAGYFSAFSSCLYYCIWGGLSVFWQCCSSLLWKFLTVGGVA